MIDNGIDGVLVDPNEDEMYDAMKLFLTNPAFVQKIVDGTENAIQKFDENEIYRQITEVFVNQYQLKVKNERV